MKRRTFFRRFLGSLGVSVAAPPIGAQGRTILIQESPVAGFQFHRGDDIWATLEVGTSLALVREPANEHDPDAVALYVGEDKLGYVPRAENSVIANMMDRGENLEAGIVELRRDEDPWERVRFQVFLL